MLSSTAPTPSIRKVPIRAWRTMRTTPSRSFRLRVDTMMSRSDRPMRRRSAKDTRVITVIKPRPPSWIISRMTSCPNRDHWTQVSTRIRPVTQVEEVAVKRAVKKPALCPSREAMGRVSSSAPTRIMMAKDAATMRVALRLRFRMKISRSQSANLLITAGPPRSCISPGDTLFYAEKHTEGRNFLRYARLISLWSQAPQARLIRARVRLQAALRRGKTHTIQHMRVHTSSSSFGILPGVQYPRGIIQR